MWCRRVLFDVVRCVVVCDVLCGVVWFVSFVCVPLLCVCVLFVICCVMVYGLSVSLCACVFACVECVCVVWL